MAVHKLCKMPLAGGLPLHIGHKKVMLEMTSLKFQTYVLMP